jgi:hypothetical protein
MPVTALVGNTIASKSELTRDGKTFPVGYLFTIQSVKYEPRAELTSTVIVLEELPGLMFEAALDTFEDYPVEMSETTAKRWFEESENRR